MLETTDARFNQLLKKKIAEEVQNVLSLSNLGAIDQYESDVAARYAKFVSRKYAYWFNSGTSSIKMALHLLDVGPGDEVIVPSHTYPATALPVRELGATPVIVDVTPHVTMDPEVVRKAITPRTKVMIPVHMYGHACDMDELQKIADEHNVHIIEDACQAHGSTWRSRPVGSFGTFGMFSFTLHKNLPGFCGGILVFDDEKYYHRIKTSTQIEPDHEDVVRFGRADARLSTIEIANVATKLKVFPLIKKSKESIKGFYKEHLPKEMTFVDDAPGSVSIRQHVLALTPQRDRLLAFLEKNNVALRPAYKPLHHYNLFGNPGPEKFPNAEKIYREGIHLPATPFISRADLERTVALIKQFFAQVPVMPSLDN